jgi:ribosomal protein L37E
MEPIYGICVECGKESPLDKDEKCSVCGTKNK